MSDKSPYTTHKSVQVEVYPHAYPKYDLNDPKFATHAAFGHMDYNEIFNGVCFASDIFKIFGAKLLPFGVPITPVAIVYQLIHESDLARMEELINKTKQNDSVEIRNEIIELKKNVNKPLAERTDRAKIPVKAFQTATLPFH